MMSSSQVPTMTTPKDTILLITNSEQARSAFETSLKDAGYGVLMTTNEQAALEAAQHATPSLIVADRQTCSFNRLRLQANLRSVPIIAVQDVKSVNGANDTEEETYLDDLDRGADLILCGRSARELIARVRAVLRRTELGRKPATYSFAGILQMDLDRHEVTVSGRSVNLTPKEFLILRCFLESPCRVFTRQEMLNCVWGDGYALEEHALDVHIHSLRQKIEENPGVPKLIVTVRGVGYKLRSDT